MFVLGVGDCNVHPYRVKVKDIHQHRDNLLGESFVCEVIGVVLSSSNHNLSLCAYSSHNTGFNYYSTDCDTKEADCEPHRHQNLFHLDSNKAEGRQGRRHHPRLVIVPLLRAHRTSKSSIYSDIIGRIQRKKHER